MAPSSNFLQSLFLQRLAEPGGNLSSSRLDVSTPPALPSPQILQKVQRYVEDWCRISVDYMTTKLPEIEEHHKLYRHKLKLPDLERERGHSSGLTTSYNRAGTTIADPAKTSSPRSDYVHPVGNLVDSWVDNAYAAIFDGPEYLSVIVEDSDLPPEQRTEVDNLAYRIQQLLLSRLERGGFHSRINDLLRYVCWAGTAIPKAYWQPDDVTGGYPVIELVPLECVLVDKLAANQDVERWSGVGHWVYRTYHQIRQGFEKGAYNLNQKEFWRRWQPQGGGSVLWDQNYHMTVGDQERHDYQETGETKLKVWEFHGVVEIENGRSECVVTIVTDQNSPYPSDGLMIRFHEGAVLPRWGRPFVDAHFTQLPAALGLGQLERQKPTIHLLSQFIAQSQDATRFTSNPAITIDPADGAAVQYFEEEGNVFRPGMIITSNTGKPISVVEMPRFDQAACNTTIARLEANLNQQATPADMTQVMGRGEKTATEISAIQNQVMTPTMTRIHLLAKSIERLANICLEMIARFSSGDQTVWVQDSQGYSRPITVTAAELQHTRFKVVASITRQDSTRIAKAQSIERCLPTLANFQPLLQQEGVMINFAEILKKYLDLLGIEGAERIIRRLTPEQQQMMAMQQMMAQQQLPPGQGPPTQLPPGQGPPPMPSDAPPPMGENGGPMGPVPSDPNIMAQILQMQQSPPDGGMW